ncbi:MAG TPA: winged helix-turn-helix domain-containing protein [Noviherbaspirillum sp.]|nr:winged helix-turn-helix domain-containing protein [Noviherbaspirillum sp.]
MHEQFQVDYSLNEVYHLLERCGMSWISARAINPQAGLSVQATFKKVRAPGPVGVATAKCRSGFPVQTHVRSNKPLSVIVTCGPRLPANRGLAPSRPSRCRH